MKLLSVAIGLMAIDMAYASTASNAYIPFDCYQESPRAYGLHEGNLETDKTRLSGLHPTDHKLVQISYCMELATETFTGLTTTWAKWVDGERSEIKRLNVIGNLSAMYEFDRNTPLKAAGLAELNQEQLWAFEPYWFQEASPFQEKFYKDRSVSHQDKAVFDAWRLAHQTYFAIADVNGDGELTRAEAEAFLINTRTYQRKPEQVNIVENWGQFSGTTENADHKLDRAWAALSIMSSPSVTFTFADWVNVEKTMETWYNAGLMDATGHAYGNYYEHTIGDNSESQNDYGETLKTQCDTFTLEEGDRIINFYVSSGEFGVEALWVQTEKVPQRLLGRSGNDLYAFENSNWIRYDQGIKEFAGFWGYSNAKSGKLNAIGFLEQDKACTQKFQVGVQNYSWVSIIPGTEVVAPVIPDGIRLEEPATVPEHEHTKKAEDGYVAGNIVVYILVLALLIAIIAMACKDMKKK